ncbi:Nitrogen regulation protein NIFR3 [Staphylococcus aureus]|nr:Nitrogen regulation protein NIFR3 [Staphylococcus aureus]
MNYTLQGYIDCGAQTQRISKRNSTSNASWGAGPNTENFKKKFYKQCELGSGPKHREFRKEILQAMQVGSGSPIGFPISTGNARLC